MKIALVCISKDEDCYIEEWVIKCNRGNADCTPSRIVSTWDEVKNFNTDIEDLTAYNFMYSD